MGKKPRTYTIHEKPAGLYDEQAPAPQLTDFVARSGAAHSPSEGWIPFVMCDLMLSDGSTTKFMIRADEEFPALMSTRLMEATMASRRDLAAAADAQKPGTGKSHGTR